jgi:hypothetical protein
VNSFLHVVLEVVVNLAARLSCALQETYMLYKLDVAVRLIMMLRTKGSYLS